MSKKKVGIIGCGNWGSTAAKIIGENVVKSQDYDPQVMMWVLEEVVDGQNLSHIINTTNQNVKYLPGVTLPKNVVAVTAIDLVVSSCTHLVFVVPHQFVESTCIKIAPHVRPNAIGISLIKGLIEDENELVLVSEIIRRVLSIPVAVLSGANIASEIAAERFSTTTIGTDDPGHGEEWSFLFSTLYFKVNVVDKTFPLEVFGALKNCIALGIGFCEALGYGMNGKASAIRVGFSEIIRFIQLYDQNIPLEIFFQSFGLDDLIATCFGGRNARAAEFFVRTKKSLQEIERDLLNGQKLQGPATVSTVVNIVRGKNVADKFPFFTYIHNILNGLAPVEDLEKILRSS